MKFFRVAKAGKTIDGREITPDQIRQMAANYNPDTYNARINLEHFRGLFADGALKSYGDVLAMDVEEVGDDLFLLAALHPTSDLVAMNQNRQKVHTSIEMDPNFADTGEAYCVGLAVTDSPASLGTSILKFARQNPDQINGVADTLDKKFISEDLEIDNFMAQGDEDPLTDQSKGWLSKFKTLIAGADKNSEIRFGDMQQAMELMAQAHNKQTADLSAKMDASDKKVEDLTGQLKDLVQKLSDTPNPRQPERPDARGTEDFTQTDC